MKQTHAPPQAVLVPKSIHDKLARIMVMIDDTQFNRRDPRKDAMDVQLFNTMLDDPEVMNWIDAQRRAGVHVATTVRR